MFPKVIHQIWLGRKPFPALGEEWTASYRRFMPDWGIKRWGDADLAELAGRLRCPRLVLDESLGMGIRCDFLRYEIARLFGGIYLDHDIEKVAPVVEAVKGIGCCRWRKRAAAVRGITISHSHPAAACYGRAHGKP